MRNHFLRAKGVAASGGGGGGGTVTTNTNITTNEWVGVYNSSLSGSNEFGAIAVDQNGSGAVFLIMESTGTGRTFGVKRVHTDRTTTTGNWTKYYSRSGNPSSYRPFKAQVDSSGNLIIVLREFHLESTYNVRPTFVKINGSTGAVVWAKAFGDLNHHNETNGSNVNGLTIDESDNIYVSGRVRGNDANSNPIHPYVMRIDSDGDLGWVKGIRPNAGTSNRGDVFGLAHLPPTTSATSDYFYIYMRYGVSTFNEGMILEVNKSNGTLNDTKFIARNTTNWGANMAPYPQNPESFHISHNGEFYIHHLKDDDEVAILKINSNLSSISWAKELTLGGSKSWRSYTSTGGIAATSDDDVVITSITTANASPSGRSNVYIASFDSSGDNNWERVVEYEFSSTSANGRYGMFLKIDADTQGNFYVSGRMPFPGNSTTHYIEGVGVIKHQADTAITAGNYITDNPNNVTGLNGVYEIEDTSHVTFSTGSWDISDSTHSGAPWYMSSAPHMPTFSGSSDSNTDWDLNSITFSATDIAAANNIYYSADL